MPSDGKILINIQADIKGNLPEFLIYTLDAGSKFKIVSNFRATITSWEFDSFSYDKTYDGDGTKIVEKNGEIIFDLSPNPLPWNEGTRALKIWFRTERNAVYFREYLLDHFNSGWYGPHPVSSNTWDY